MTTERKRAASAAPQQAPNGTWFFRVDVAGVDGKRRQTTKRGFATKKAAQEALDSEARARGLLGSGLLGSGRQGRAG